NKHFVQPILSLTSVSSKIAVSNDLDHEIDTSASGELGTLAKSFATMRDSVKQKISELNEEIDERRQVEAELRISRRELARHRDNLEITVKERTEELVYAKDKAEDANCAKSEFLANMSHEIRTPMNAVLGFTEILRGLLVEPQNVRYIENIHSSGKALLNLINDILDLSKVESGKLELQYRPLSIKELFSEVNTVFSQKVSSENLQFVVKLDEGFPGVLLLDETRLRQVLINLTGNAIKFTHKGYISLHGAYELSQDSVNRLSLSIEVEDSGIGIPEDQQEKIFGAFEQMSGQKVKQFGGTGLGLAISKRLIEMMGGTLTVKSKVGSGSTFIVHLPDVEILSVDQLVSFDNELHNFEKLSFEPAIILIVDDIDYNREIIRTFLNGFGFTVHEGKNGLEALELVYKYHPDLILLDMKMPLMDGYEVSQKLNDDEVVSMIPVIAVTSSALKQDEQVISQLCNGYLRKPLSKAELLTELILHLPHFFESEEVAQESVSMVETCSREQVKGLLRVLKEKLIAERCQELSHLLTINRMIEMKDELCALKEHFPHNIFTDWVDEFSQGVELYDTAAVEGTLLKYPQMESVLSLE
ncbi:MAG: response regulator, partial [Lentisphaeraceae bacterium]|nr:response regulator [Lentisphaeraceae bacterium]